VYGKQQTTSIPITAIQLKSYVHQVLPFLKCHTHRVNDTEVLSTRIIQMHKLAFLLV